MPCSTVVRPVPSESGVPLASETIATAGIVRPLLASVEPRLGGCSVTVRVELYRLVQLRIEPVR
jgi:hypothetical protein